MTSITVAPEPVEQPEPPSAPAPRRRSWRARVAALERPLLLAGLALVAAHLLDLALSGPATSALAVALIVAVPLGWALAQPRLSRPTRLALAVAVGLLTIGFGTVSHGLHVVNYGPDLRDLTGVGYVAGGLALVLAGLAAIAAPRRPPRRSGLGWRAAHAGGWLAGAALIAVAGVMPFAGANLPTHAPRWAIDTGTLAIAHEDVTISTDGRDLTAWYVPSRNGAAVLVSHGSGGSRGRLPRHVEMLARHGYGVLALDNPGNGGSDGHSNGLGDNAQPGIRAALDWLSDRPEVEPGRIAGFGLSLGGEVLLEAASRDSRLAAVVSDGGARPMDTQRVMQPGAVQRAVVWETMQLVRGISGMESSTSLVPMMPRIAPRPVLLVAGDPAAGEIKVARAYREAGGATVELWELPDTAHTGGLRTHPREYERRTVAFLDRALGAR
jgi:uncharacterized protein